MYNFIDLFPFLQLMAGLNFAPSFFSSLQSRYFDPIIQISNSYKLKLITSFDKKIFDINNGETLTTGLSESEKEQLQKLVNKAKGKSIEFLETLKNTYLDEFKTQTDKLNNKVAKIIHDDKRRVRFSFLLSGIFSISILLFYPISNLFFPDLCSSIFVRYLDYFLIFQLGFQLIFFFKKGEDYFSTLITYIGSILLIFIIHIIYFKYYSEKLLICPCNYQDYFWKQISIVLLVISTLTTFWLYLIKYIYLIIQNKIYLDNEFKNKYNSIIETLKTLEQ